MAELRICRGWSKEEIAARLAGLELLSTSVDGASRKGRQRWHPERVEAVIAREPPGFPSRAGPFEHARELIAHYRFSDPRIVRAHFDRSRSLLGRRMLLELRVLGLRYLCGTVVGAVHDESTDHETSFGYRYDTLEGHIERGQEWFVLRKDHTTGAVLFCIASRWRKGAFPNWWSRVGFSVLAGHYRAKWLQRAYDRMRAMLGGKIMDETRQGSAVSEYAMATLAGAISGSRSMMGPWAAAMAAYGRAERGTAGALASGLPVISALMVGELLADKHPRIPSRMAPLPWLGRAVAGAFAAGAGASLLGRSSAVGAVLGGVAAGATTWASGRARAHLANRIREPFAGLVEDALVTGLGLAFIAIARDKR